jgi:L-asparagine transporter-like permease
MSEYQLVNASIKAMTIIGLIIVAVISILVFFGVKKLKAEDMISEVQI